MADFLYIDLGTDSTFYYAQTHKGFDGVSRRAVWEVTRGKGFNVAEIADIPCRNFGLLIPCNRSVTAAIQDFIDLQRQYVEPNKEGYGHKGPYYFTMNMCEDPDFETASVNPPLFGGPYTAYGEALAENATAPYERHWLLAKIFGERSGPAENRQNFRLARYNCWTHAQGIAQYVGGADLSLIDPGFATTYRIWSANGVFSDLLLKLRQGDAAYEVQAATEDFVLGRRRDGGLPFILIDQPTDLETVLNSALSGSGRTVEETLNAQPLFTRKPVTAHVHMTQKPPKPEAP